MGAWIVHLHTGRRKMLEGEHTWERELGKLSAGQEEASSCEAAWRGWGRVGRGGILKIGGERRFEMVTEVKENRG